MCGERQGRPQRLGLAETLLGALFLEAVKQPILSDTIGLDKTRSNLSSCLVSDPAAGPPCAGQADHPLQFDSFFTIS
jgi:hypothetical protein